MKFRISLALILSIFSLLSTVALAGTAHSYKRIIVFGDSYSDNGNDFKLTKQLYPNPIRYYKGRFCDGLAWVEYFAKQMNIDPNDPNQFINFAYGQAKVLSPTTITVTGPTDKTYSIPSLSNEINLYGRQYKTFHADDLVIVFIATNDFFDLPDKNASLFFQKIAHQEIKNIHELISKGAKHIIVFNGRDVTYSPLAKIVARKNTRSSNEKTIDEYLRNFKKLIGIYNKTLSMGLVNHPEVFIYDINQFDDQVIQKIKKEGFSYQFGHHHYVFNHAKSSCYQNNQGDYQGIAGPVCEGPQSYFFFDRIHTTHYLNYVLANDLYTQFFKN